MRIEILLLWILIISSSFSGCEKAANLSPTIGHFTPSLHLKKIDGREGLSRELLQYIHNEQSLKRTVASSTNSDKTFSPENNPKFPLPYFLIPDDRKSPFLSADTNDEKILDELRLKISGQPYHKLFIHPAHEKEYNYLRRVYDYIGPDRTEFLATPTSDYYTLVVWNRNNPKRRAFMTKLDLEKPEQGIKVQRELIKELPLMATTEKK